MGWTGLTGHFWDRLSLADITTSHPKQFLVPTHRYDSWECPTSRRIGPSLATIINVRLRLWNGQGVGGQLPVSTFSTSTNISLYLNSYFSRLMNVSPIFTLLFALFGLRQLPREIYLTVNASLWSSARSSLFLSAVGAGQVAYSGFIRALSLKIAAHVWKWR